VFSVCGCKCNLGLDHDPIKFMQRIADGFTLIGKLGVAFADCRDQQLELCLMSDVNVKQIPVMLNSIQRRAKSDYLAK